MVSVGGARSDLRKIRPLPYEILDDYCDADAIESSATDDAFQQEKNMETRHNLQEHLHSIEETQDELLQKKMLNWLPSITGGWPVMLFVILDRPQSSYLGKIIGLILTATILASITSFVLSTDEGVRGDNEVRSSRREFEVIELLCLVIFTIEYAYRLLLVPFVSTAQLQQFGYMNRRITQSRCCCSTSSLQRLINFSSFVTNPMNIVDLLSLVPIFFYMSGYNQSELLIIRVFRLTRGFRLIKLGRLRDDLWWFKYTIEKSKLIFNLVFFIILGTTFAFAVAVFHMEKGEWNEEHGYYERPNLFGTGKEQTPFSNVLISAWWVICTATGVGYGDLYPTTNLGKVVGGICMYAGIVGLALPLATIAMNLVDAKREIDVENRMLKIALGGNIEQTPELLVKAADELLEICDEMTKLNKSMKFWTGLAEPMRSHAVTNSLSEMGAVGLRSPPSLRRSTTSRRGGVGSIYAAVAGLRRCTCPKPVLQHTSVPSLNMEQTCAACDGKVIESETPVSIEGMDEAKRFMLPPPDVSQVLSSPQKTKSIPEHSTGPVSLISSIGTHNKTLPRAKRNSMDLSSRVTRTSSSLPRVRMSRQHSDTRMRPTVDTKFAEEEDGKGRDSDDVIMMTDDHPALFRQGAMAMRVMVLGDSARRVDSMIRLIEQSSLMLAFSDVVVMRIHAMLLARLFREENSVHTFSVWDWLCCRSKGETGERSGPSERKSEENKEVEAEAGLGYVYEKANHRMHVKLVTSQVVATLSERACQQILGEKSQINRTNRRRGASEGQSNSDSKDDSGPSSSDSQGSKKTGGIRKETATTEDLAV